MTEISKDVIVAYALDNSTKHGGRANPNAILSGLFAEGLEKSEIKKIMPLIQKVVREVNKMPENEQKKKLEIMSSKVSKRKIREGLKELPNAEIGKVVMRMSPFPSGPLHIGNVRTMILNDEYAKMYDGRLLIVMDDTIGSEKKQIEPAAYKLIEEAVKWLGIKFDKNIIYKSDRTKKYYAYAEEMLKKGYLYVCDCEQETMHRLRKKGVACSCRVLPPEIQIKRWEKMFKAKMGSMVVRLKTDMQDPDPAFRDRVMFKISDRPHPRTGAKFRIYPSMEFSWAIDDHLLGCTHILRGVDHYMSTRVQNFIRRIFGWENPESIYNGHFAIEGLKISKSGATQKIKSGEYIGWNDPRTWSVQSLRDRGIKPEAIREFILGLGMRKTSITAPIESLYILNRKLLEDVPRYFFVENPTKITIRGCPYLETKIPLHPNRKLGNRQYKTTQDFLVSEKDFNLMEDGVYRLMYLLTFKSDNLDKMKPRTFSFISEEPDNNLRTKFLQWLPATPDNFDVKIIMPDGKMISGKGEYALEKLKVGETIQFERFGFVRLHKKEKDSLEFWFAHN